MCKIDKAHQRQLNNAYRKDLIVPFIGAGLSIPFGMPGWGSLIESISRDYNITIPDTERNSIINLINDMKYLEAVENIKKHGVREEDIRKSICNEIKSKKKLKEMPDNIYNDLAKMNFKKYLTTNYDNYLSDYLNTQPRNIKHLSDEFINEIDDSLYENIVYNLHGDYQVPSSIVLSKKSYDDLYYNDRRFREILEHFRKRYILLFIGTSLEDKYIQEVLEVSKDKLKARHFVILPQLSKERRKILEEGYNITILEYEVINGDHTAGIRDILNEITKISHEIEEQIRYDKNLDKGLNYFNNEQNLKIQKSESFLLVNEEPELPSKDSKIYNKLKEIIEIQNRGEIDEAIIEYNKILQASIGEPLTSKEKKLVIKGLLHCHVLNRDYTQAAEIVKIGEKLPKLEESLDIFSYIIDYYVNTLDYNSAYETARDWYEKFERNSIIRALYLYAKTLNEKQSYEDTIEILLTPEQEIKVDTKDDIERQYIYRLSGEIALLKRKYDDAIIFLIKAYELNDNIYNIEDLGIAYYLKALEQADNGTIIKINKIDLSLLSKAVEYFELAFSKAKSNGIKGVYSRLSIPYLRSLFYLRRIIEFDTMYDNHVKYCQDDLLEIKRMRALNNLWLNKFKESDVEGQRELDKVLILNEYYTKNEMFDHAVMVMEDIIDKGSDINEEIFVQFLASCFNTNDIERFNSYYRIYNMNWPNGENKDFADSLFYEINGQYIEAEEKILKRIAKEPVITNYNVLTSFYTRTRQIGKIGQVYEDILINKPEFVELDKNSFYMAYHLHLMGVDNIERAIWLYENKIRGHVSPDTQLLVEVDLKMRLEDYSQLADESMYLYDKYKIYGDIIHAFNAAVAYLFNNEFEKSRYCINLYKSNGHVDHRSHQLVTTLENRLDILQKRVRPDWSTDENYLKGLARKVPKDNPEISIPQNEPFVINNFALYILQSKNMLEALKYKSKIIIAYKSIEQLHDIYIRTGDDAIIEIVKYIKNSNNISLRSPSMSNVLRNRSLLYNDQGILDSESIAFENGYPLVTLFRKIRDNAETPEIGIGVVNICNVN